MYLMASNLACWALVLLPDERPHFMICTALQHKRTLQMALNQTELVWLDSLIKARDGQAPDHTPNIVDLMALGLADVEEIPGGVNKTLLTGDGCICLGKLLQKQGVPAP